MSNNNNNNNNNSNYSNNDPHTEFQQLLNELFERLGWEDADEDQKEEIRGFLPALRKHLFLEHDPLPDWFPISAHGVVSEMNDLLTEHADNPERESEFMEQFDDFIMAETGLASPNNNLNNNNDNAPAAPHGSTGGKRRRRSKKHKTGRKRRSTRRRRSAA